MDTRSGRSPTLYSNTIVVVIVIGSTPYVALLYTSFAYDVLFIGISLSIYVCVAFIDLLGSVKCASVMSCFE